MKKEILNYILIVGISLTMVVPNFRSLDQMIPEFIYFGIITALSLGYITFFGLGSKHTRSLAKSPLTISILVFFSISVLSLFFAVNKYESMIGLSKYLIIITSVYALSILMKNIKPTSFFILIISLLFIETTKVLYEFYKLYDFQAPKVRHPYYAGFAANVNVTAFSILFKLPFLVFLIQKETLSRFIKILLILLLSCSFFGILICFSRGALIAFIISAALYIIYFFIFRFKRINYWYKKVGMMLIALIFTFGFYSFLFQNAQNSNLGNRITSFDLKDSTSSINFRITYFKNAFQAMLDQPFTGFGIENWKIVSIKYVKEKMQFYEVPYHAHNDFLQIGAETGIIGFLSYIFIFLYIFYKLIKQIFQEDKIHFDKDKYLPFILCILIYCFDSSINFPRARPVNVINLSLVIGFLMSKNFKLDAHENI